MTNFNLSSNMLHWINIYTTHLMNMTKIINIFLYFFICINCNNYNIYIYIYRLGGEGEGIYIYIPV